MRVNENDMATRNRCVVLERAVVSGLTISGAVLLDSYGKGYRIEIGREGVERLAHLCDLFLKDCSNLQDQPESAQK